MMGLGEWIVVLIIVLVLFGSSKLPALGDGLGKAIRNFKDATRDEPPARKDAPRPPQAGA